MAVRWIGGKGLRAAEEAGMMEDWWGHFLNRNTLEG